MILHAKQPTAEAIQRRAIDLAASRGQARIEPEHLLLAMLTDPDELVPVLIKKLTADPQQIAREVEAILDQLSPKAHGGASTGAPTLSAASAEMVREANVEAEGEGTAVTGAEHLFKVIGKHEETEVSRILVAANVKAHTISRGLRHLRNMRTAAPDHHRTKTRDIGSRRQMFIDDFLIADMESLKRRFHCARKHGPPILKPAHAWEGAGGPRPSVYLFSGALWDAERRLYRMWYTTTSGRLSGRHLMLYAESEDGVDWRRPLDVGGMSYDGSEATNILLDDINPQCVLHMPQASDPAHRYQLFGHAHGKGYVYRHSFDGLRWSNARSITALQGYWDLLNVAWDADCQRYIMVVKQSHDWDYVHPALGKNPGIRFRTWYTSTSHDGQNWSQPQPMHGDLDDIDRRLYMEGEGCAMLNTYGVSLFAYHGLFLGMQWLFRITDPWGNSTGQGGPMDGRLLVCRDWGQPWTIPARTFQLPRGGQEAWDWGMICGISGSPVLSPAGDEWYYYYGGWDHGHAIPERRTAIGLAAFRVDGFASLEAVGVEGELHTHPLTFSGSKLLLNIKTSPPSTSEIQPYARVEMADATGTPIPGYRFADCDPIHEDAINHVVTWSGKADVSLFAGDTIFLRIRLRGGELYAMQFSD